MRVLVAVALLVCGSRGWAQVSQAAASSSPTMVELYVEHQRDRGVALAANGKDMLPKAEADALPELTWEQINRRDEERRKRVRSLLDEGKLKRAEEFHQAAFIFQHGQRPEDYLLAHVLATDAMARGDASARWIAAATLDRYLQGVGQKQVFGTQYSDEKYAFYLKHRADPNMAEEVKAFTGTGETLEPYDPGLLPAGMRHDFCVPEVAVQNAYISAVHAGKKVDLPRVANCAH